MMACLSSRSGQSSGSRGPGFGDDVGTGEDLDAPGIEFRLEARDRVVELREPFFQRAVAGGKYLW